jgi:Raf kinase inhibitor-like YbhB/YbcL family protein
MLEKVPAVIGRLLRRAKVGSEELTYHDPAFAEQPCAITVESSAFEDGGAMPATFTDDGDRISPPLRWIGVPEAADAVVLIVEDADSPTPSPLVHAICWDLPGEDGEIGAGDLDSPCSVGEGHTLGRNSSKKTEYLPPDPPKGHGPHRYAFQVFALDSRLDFDAAPDRRQVIEAMRGHVLAKGCLVGLYERR